MIIDLNNCFTYAYSAGTIADYFQTIRQDAASTNYIDLDAANLNIAAGKPIFLIVLVGTAFVRLTSLDIRLESDTDPGFGTALKQINTWNVAIANLITAGACVVNQALPVQIYQRYMRIYFNVIDTNPDSGSTICAFLSESPWNAFSQLDLVAVA